MGTIMLELCRQERLLRVMEERGFTLCQQNGQRTYGGPPPNWGMRPPPHRESEIFIGRLPRMCFEDELIPLFSSIGELYEFRLMLDFSGTNRGFAYAHYVTEESAMNAIKVLNHYEIRPGHYIGVLRSKNNCRLLFSNIKRDMDSHTFTECVRTLTNEVLSVCIFASFEELKAAEMGLSLEVEEAFQEKMARYAPHSKFAVVEYETHKAAAVARRILIPKLGHMFAIDWAIPQEKTHIDQNYNFLFDACLAPGNDFVKARPVPIFNPRRSSLDGVLYATSAFRNIAKYFRFLMNTTLHKAMRKGDIPLAVYLELERKIIERVKNIEHCGQATQLILNYLAWYGEKMMMMIDPISEKILTEVKYYSERMLQIASNRLACLNEVKSEMEEYVSNTLLAHLNFCYYMAVFLSGDERERVCGLITNSLNWFEDIMQRVRLGNENVTQFLKEVSLLAGEMEEERKKGMPALQAQNSRKRKLEPIPLPNIPGWTPFSGQSFPPLKKNASPGKNDQESMETAECDSRAVPFSQRLTARPIEAPISNKENHGVPRSSTVIKGQPKGSNLFGALSGMPSPVVQPSQCTPDHSVGIASQILPTILGAKGRFPSYHNKEVFPGLDIESKKCLPVPVLMSQPSIADFVTYMPKPFRNVVKYYKYIIMANLQKSVERCEVTLQTYRELTTKVINSITNLETCVQGIGLIIDYLADNRDTRLPSVHCDLFNVLQDVRLYATSLINYMYSRGSFGVSPNADMEEYYCRLFPNQMSFLYHLTILLNGEERAKISGRLTESLLWLSEFIEKNKAGDVEVVEFFERIFRIGAQNGDGSLTKAREIIKDVYDEFNTLLGPYRAGGN